MAPVQPTPLKPDGNKAAYATPDAAIWPTLLKLIGIYTVPAGFAIAGAVTVVVTSATMTSVTFEL